MKELSEVEINEVSGAVDQSTAIGAQMGFVAIGTGLAVAGFALTPFGAVLFIGTSLAITGSFIYHHYSSNCR